MALAYAVPPLRQIRVSHHHPPELRGGLVVGMIPWHLFKREAQQARSWGVSAFSTVLHSKLTY